MEPLKVVVIGAGVVGLSTALCLQKEFPSIKVTVIADKIGDDTLSAGAGGLFRPEINMHHNFKRMKKWCADSLSHFLEIISSADCSEAGMQLVSGYHLSTCNSSLTENPLLEELLPEFRKLSEKELHMFPPHFKYGVFYTTVITDCRYYLSWMKAKFEAVGGKIILKNISSFSEIHDEYKIIVNCTGLGAKQLANDKMLVPIRGQTIKVKAPWIKNFYYGDDAYIIPGLDYVTLGGIKDYGSWNTKINPYQKQFIWDKCTELVPSLKRADIAWEWVGLRPYRPSVRVDVSFHDCNGKLRPVVNNYGHGGHGVTLSWGTAVEATRNVKKLLSKKEFVSKL